MTDRDEAFTKRLLETFKAEAAEHLGALSSGLMEFDTGLSAARQDEVIEVLFREAHSMKGAARSVNLTRIENLCQSFETVLAALKRKEIAPGRPLLDLLHRTVNALGELLASLEGGGEGGLKGGTQALISELHQAAQPSSGGGIISGSAGPSPAEAPSPSLGRAAFAVDTIRIGKAKLDSLLLQGEAFLALKQTAAHQTAELRTITDAVAALGKSLAGIGPPLHRSRATGKKPGRSAPPADGAEERKLLELLEAAGDQAARLHHSLLALGKSQRRNQRSLGTMVDGLLGDLKALSLLPFSTLLELMPKIARDLARDQGKETVLVIGGEDVEIDKRILDEIREPLIHLVRNGIDHGIETPEERRSRNKPEAGTITISVSRREGRSVEVVVADDGRGIDVSGIRDAAVRLGVLSRREAAERDDREALQLMFRSGVSTSPIITDISGRGLGLAIVRERVERLGGTISCEAREGGGTAFHLQLPLTLTTLRGVLARIGDGQYIIPTLSLDRTVRVRREEITTLENRETISIEGQAVAFVPLRTVLELPRQEKKNGREFLSAVVLGSGERRIAFGVDEIVQEQEVLVKNLGPQLKRVRNVSGATVLGAGRVVPILNAPDLLKSAVKASAAAPAPAAVTAAQERKSILVVEDSITTRSLLKNILESLGYEVRTAVDGVDALTTLRTADFDLVVSDVDMPRMNGFDLTAKIRSDKRLAGTPVILVTALESREDRERGVDVGANAYIVKSSFDQGNLLAAVKRLI